MERLGACSIGSPWPWQWDLERNACARRLIFEGAIPTAFLAICWWIGDFGRPGTLTLSARPLLKAGVRVPDNRVWVGPAVVLLMIVQTAVQTARATEPASLVLATEWLILSLVATMQAARYTKSDRFAFRGLFSGMLFGFVLVQFACSALEEYFSFFVRSQWHTPMWGEDMSSVAATAHVKMLVNSVLLLLLLTVHPLPQCDYVADRVSQPQVGCQLQPKRLTALPGAKLEPYELSQPLLSVLLFNWVSPILSDCRREHQVSRSDLRVPPDNCQVSSAYARFSMGAKPGQPLVGQLFSVFKVDLAIQIVYTFYNTFSDYIQPYLMQRVLRFIDEYLEDSSLGLRFGYFLAAMMLAASVVGTVVEQQQQWQSRGISMEIRNVLVASLTQKTLRRRAHESKSKGDSSRDSSDGRVYNILTADVNRVNKLPEMFGSVLFSPCQLIIGCFYMYQLLGIAGLFGTAMIVGVMAVGQRLIVRAKRIEAQIGRFNDQRLETISEVIHGIISVKLFGWCSKFIQVVGIKRAVQLEALWQRSKVWSLLNLWTVGMMPVIIFVVLFVYSFNGRLDGETTFTAIAVFRVLQRAIFWMPGGVSHAISIYVSLKRIDEYLQEEDVQPAAERVEAAGHDVGFSQAQLVWKRADDGAAAEEETPLLLHGRQPEDSQAFALRNLTVRFPQGGLTIIGGPTGSGKSSLLSALVGEMTVVSGKIHIPMSANGVMSDIAYVSQEPWLRNATIRDNVLFGELYIRDRYEEVLRMCGLKPDLRTFVAGDQSEVGERGITLSGGQKQRVALARAVYSSRRILLIDDCLSAVDSHTGKHILHTCLLSQSPLMHGRTRILVTHHMAMCLPHCQYVVMIRSGEIVAKGTPQEVSGCAFDDVVAASDGESQGEQAPAVQRQAFEDPMPEDEYNDERRAPADTPAAAGSQTGMQEASPTGQLIKEEVRMSGTIKASVWAGYFVASGGWVHVVFCAILIVAVQLLSAYKDYYLALRVGSDKSHDSESFQYAWLFIYLLVSLSSSVLRMVAMLLTYHGGLRASTILHERLTNAVMYATPHFMTTTPIGRTLARFAKDFQVIDESIALSMFDFATSFVIASSTLVIISAAVPLFAVVGIAVLGAYTSFTLDFMLSQRELKRLESTVFAPVLSLYSELIQGIDTIRGFGMQEAYMGEFTERFTEYVASDLTFRSTRRWLGSRMGLTSSLVGATTTVFILWKVEYFTSGLAGFIMIIAVNFWLESMGVVRRYCNLEMGFNSVERVFQYLEIDQEAPAKSSVGNKPCPGWPLRGEIEVRDLVAGYFANEPVLHGLSFSVCAGEKIGIVGRTGAGKSTLSLSLLRFVEATSGQVLIDGVDISKIGLEDLRQNITIVPQDPVLFNGTIRFNLDPFGEYPDEILLDALKRTLLLKSTHESAGDRSVAVFDSLDDEIISNGQNLSLGQRQLVALARTLTRRSKVILMDEATASVDFETDEAMQRTIRGAEFKSSTILCIAHRLHTIIDYDRVLVLENGRVEEFGTPAELIQAESGAFRTLCEKSGDMESLTKMIKW